MSTVLWIFTMSLFSSAVGFAAGTLNERKVWQKFAREVVKRKKLLRLSDEDWDEYEEGSGTDG